MKNSNKRMSILIEGNRNVEAFYYESSIHPEGHHVQFLEDCYASVAQQLAFEIADACCIDIDYVHIVSPEDSQVLQVNSDLEEIFTVNLIFPEGSEVGSFTSLIQ